MSGDWLDNIPGPARDAAFMARALQLAERGRYTTTPNPCVGCVIVRNGRVVGEGWHKRAGEPHAERIALAAAGVLARGADVYVTLEPCAHHGRTPPCTDALIEAGVGRVLCAMTDPNPLVSGRGMSRLARAGISVESGLLEAAARALNPGFIRRMEQGVPHLRCKLAASLDGRTAMADGASRWITSPEARQDVQRWRARSCAILSGISTLLADDSSLNVRLSGDELGLESGEAVRQPLRVVIDSRWRLPLGARLLSLPGETLVVGAEDNAARRTALEAAGARTLLCPGANGRVDLVALMHELGQLGINEALLESGAMLAGAALSAGLVDELLLYQAPHLMGDEARGLLKLPGIQRMEERIALEFVEVRRIGSDLRVIARPRLTESAPSSAAQP